MPEYVALLRGINVGRAKRVSMADLREAVSEMGYDDVRTVLASGNVLFTSPKALPRSIADDIRTAVANVTGVSASVIVVPVSDIKKMIRECPLAEGEFNPRLLLAGIPQSKKDLSGLKELLKQDWAPEKLAVGTHAAYIYSPEGVSNGQLFTVLSKKLKDRVTTRNWATLQKLVGPS